MSQEELVKSLGQFLHKGVSAEDIKTALLSIGKSENKKPEEEVMEAKELSPEEWFVSGLEEVLNQAEKEKNNNNEETVKHKLNLKVREIALRQYKDLEMPGEPEEKMETLQEIFKLATIVATLSFSEYADKFAKIIQHNKQILARKNNSHEEEQVEAA